MMVVQFIAEIVELQSQHVVSLQRQRT